MLAGGCGRELRFGKSSFPSGETAFAKSVGLRGCGAKGEGSE